MHPRSFSLSGRIRGYAVLPLAMFCLFVFGLTSAQAYVKHDWGNHFVQPGAQFWSGSFQNNETGNVVLYEGSGESHLCERVFNAALVGEQVSCGVNGAGGAGIVENWLEMPLQNGMSNQGSFAHTYHGYWFSP